VSARGEQTGDDMLRWKCCLPSFCHQSDSLLSARRLPIRVGGLCSFGDTTTEAPEELASHHVLHIRRHGAPGVCKPSTLILIRESNGQSMVRSPHPAINIPGVRLRATDCCQWPGSILMVVNDWATVVSAKPHYGCRKASGRGPQWTVFGLLLI